MSLSELRPRWFRRVVLLLSAPLWVPFGIVCCMLMGLEENVPEFCRALRRSWRGEHQIGSTVYEGDGSEED